jgi:hypothetical protein
MELWLRRLSCGFCWMIRLVSWRSRHARVELEVECIYAISVLDYPKRATL